MGSQPESCFFRSNDGLKLHYLHAAPGTGGERLPAVCLPGLARCADDFARLAAFLATESATPRPVIAFDYRGRGRSEWAQDWQQYSLEIERNDILRALAERNVSRAHFIGTSRGGLHILGLAASHREMIGAAVLNDIGPVLEVGGLRRIKGYVGRAAAPRSFAEAVALLKIGGGRHFTGLSSEEWQVFAETTFGTDESRLGLRYDPQIARTLDAFDLDEPLPDSWALFDKLHGAHVLTIRGEHSDLLSDTTLMAMGGRWPESQTWQVSGQGHAPLLLDQPTLARIDAFLADADEKIA